MGLPHEEHNDGPIRQHVEEKVKSAVKNQAKKLIKKALKKAAKMAWKAIQKLVLQLVKMLLTLLLGVDLPVLLIIGAVVLLLVIMLALSSSFMGKDMDTGDKQYNHLQSYVRKAAQGTVDMQRKEQIPFMVPRPLISSAVQIKAAKDNTGAVGENEALIDEMANTLKPEFTYGNFNEYTEKQVITCKKGQCSSGRIKRSDHKVSKLTNVNAWNGQTAYSYSGYVTPWKSSTKITYDTESYSVTEMTTVKVPYIAYKEVKVPYKTTETVWTWDFSQRPPRKVSFQQTVIKYKTKKVKVTKYKDLQVPKVVQKTKKVKVTTTTKTRRKRFHVSKNHTEDYTTFDQMMDDQGYNVDDKKMIAAMYETAAQGTANPPFNYEQWLSGGGGIGGYQGTFDGTIIPGKGVPPQFMPFYINAGKQFGVDWYVLAGIHYVETKFSSIDVMVSSAGALGPMQFLPSTFAAYQVDGDKNGVYDINSNADAIFTAAHYLKASGYSKSVHDAIFAYNHAEWYVNRVMAKANEYRDEASYKPNGDMPEVTPGSFMRPTTGRITSPYGLRGTEFHLGIDIGGGGRTGNVPIVSVADGTVTRSYTSNSYGNCVFIQHNVNGQKYESVYAHMKYIPLVRVGQKVKKGQVIGYMGQTGAADGMHLHFELYKNAWCYHNDCGNALNPALYIPF